MRVPMLECEIARVIGIFVVTKVVSNEPSIKSLYGKYLAQSYATRNKISHPNSCSKFCCTAYGRTRSKIPNYSPPHHLLCYANSSDEYRQSNAEPPHMISIPHSSLELLELYVTFPLQTVIFWFHHQIEQIIT